MREILSPSDEPTAESLPRDLALVFLVAAAAAAEFHRRLHPTGLLSYGSSACRVAYCTVSAEKKTWLSAGKILALVVIWVGTSALLRFVTGSHWGLCILGGLGGATLTLSFWIPDEDAPKDAKDPSKVQDKEATD